MDEVIRRAGDCAPRAAVESRLMWHPIFTAPKHRVILLAHFHRNGDGPLFPLWVEDAQWVGCPTCGAWDVERGTAEDYPPTHWREVGAPEDV